MEDMEEAEEIVCGWDTGCIEGEDLKKFSVCSDLMKSQGSRSREGLCSRETTGE